MGQPTYYWKQVYEIDAEEIHWALCDSDSAKEGLVTDHCMVLHSHYPTCCDGQPLSEQPVPKRIVELLNRYGLHDNYPECGMRWFADDDEFC